MILVYLRVLLHGVSNNTRPRYVVKSALLTKIPNLKHGFGHKNQKCPIEFEEFKGTNSFAWKQVHGIHTRQLTKHEHPPGEADGFYTKIANLPLRVITADCVPVLLAKKDGSAIAALHAGWRGTLDGIVEKFFLEHVNRPAEWVAALGPSIQPCCYEFGANLIERFKTRFHTYDLSSVIPKPRRINIQQLNYLILKKIGVEKIDTLSQCTYCNEDPVFFSHRKRTKLNIDEGKLCQWSVIMKMT